MKRKTLEQLAREQAKRIGFEPRSREADYINYGFAKGYALALRRIKRRSSSHA